jgi:hypothetical protein
MADELQLTHPWLVAVWPGMGHVGLNAGIYLLAKLGMTQVAEFDAPDVFDVDHVEVKDGIIQPGRRPRSRLFVWIDPDKKRDLVVFLGEAQPPVGKYPFCRQLVAHAQRFQVERIFTFAAMATRMNPEGRSRVFGAATDPESLAELKRLELTIVEDGQISGLNGVLLGAAAEAGLRGSCLLGEMPHLFAQFPYPKGSLAVLKVFTTITGIEVDTAELVEQARAMDEQLGELLNRMSGRDDDEPEEEPEAEPEEAEGGLKPRDQKRIDGLFDQAAKDRSKAFELKRELDRLGVFKDYEDRFLDLFRKT